MYHCPQAHGLCFSALPPTPTPPSLRNIYKELERGAQRWHARVLLFLSCAAPYAQTWALRHQPVVISARGRDVVSAC